MKVIVAGGRDLTDKKLVWNTLDHMFIPFGALMPEYNLISELVCGMARGADTLAEQWAIANWIPVKEFPADWEKHGRGAGHIRNREMAKYGDVLVAFWDGKSRGTKGMIFDALEEGCQVHVYRYGKDNVD